MKFLDISVSEWCDADHDAAIRRLNVRFDTKDFMFSFEKNLDPKIVASAFEKIATWIREEDSKQHLIYYQLWRAAWKADTLANQRNETDPGVAIRRGCRWRDGYG